jgi:hypothetical protein
VSFVAKTGLWIAAHTHGANSAWATAHALVLGQTTI